MKLLGPSEDDLGPRLWIPKLPLETALTLGARYLAGMEGARPWNMLHVSWLGISMELLNVRWNSEI